MRRQQASQQLQELIVPCWQVPHCETHCYLRCSWCAVLPCRMLMRYPDNTKLLRAYARFLEHVRHDPWSANK